MTAPSVVVTGGTGALGRAVVEALLARGTRVSVPYRAEAGWHSLRHGQPADALWGAPADVADPEAARRFVDQAAVRFGRLDGLAAIAGGYAGSGPFETAPDEEWEQMLRVNLETCRSACRAALPHLLRHGGSIVTVGARLAETGGAGAAAYAAAKAGVVALTRSLALENRERGVRANCVLPATIDTPANRQAMPGADASRWTRPAEIAAVVAFLLSRESAAVSGAVIPVGAR